MKPVKLSLYFLTSSLLLIAGCGPQDLNEEAVQEGLHEAALNKDAQVAPLPNAGKCDGAQCKIPQEPIKRTVVQLPDEIEVQPTRIINTGEKQVKTEYVDYHVTRHVWQPIQIRHTILDHRNLLQRFFLDTTVFN